jgi:hypothetical protein
VGFESWIPKAVPRPYRGFWGTRFFTAIGRRMDAIVQLARNATLARLPFIGNAGDALDMIGKDRGIPRAPAETDDAYALVLQHGWEIWQGDNTPLTGVGGGAASHLGMLLALERAGCPMGVLGVKIVQQNGRYAQLVAGALTLGTLMNCVNRQDLTGVRNSRPGWTFEGRDNFYSEFGLLFPETAVIDVAAVNAAVETWRPAKALYIGAWMINTGTCLGWPLGRTLGTEPNLGLANVDFFAPARGDDKRIGYRFIG